MLLTALGATAPSARAAVTACQVTYTVQTDWGVGFTTNVHIANLGDPVDGWTLTFTFPGNQQITQGWSATWTQAAGSADVSAVNLSWNASLASGGTADIGFNGADSGTNSPPTAFALNGVACQGPSPPPAVALTSPAPGATFTAPATIPLAANASDPNGTVTQVDFLNGTTVIGTDTTAPYTFDWTGVPTGSYSLTARATDDGGASTLSAPVGVTVQPNTGPSVLADPATLTVPEGGTTSFGMRLSAQPTADVTVTVALT